MDVPELVVRSRRRGVDLLQLVVTDDDGWLELDLKIVGEAMPDGDLSTTYASPLSLPPDEVGRSGRPASGYAGFHHQLSDGSIVDIFYGFGPDDLVVTIQTRGRPYVHRGRWLLWIGAHRERRLVRVGDTEFTFACSRQRGPDISLAE